MVHSEAAPRTIGALRRRQARRRSFRATRGSVGFDSVRVLLTKRLNEQSSAASRPTSCALAHEVVGFNTLWTSPTTGSGESAAAPC
jgi:hypothetical protein